MEGMILAAGLGTRLGTLTDDVPKALIEVGGKPLLAWVMGCLVEAGVTRIIVNIHHHEEQIRSYLQRSTPPGVEVVFSPEPDEPLETGGGLFQAAPLFQEKEPFLLHNADVLSSIPLGKLYDQHVGRGKEVGERLIASLAVQNRESRRALLFDDGGLMGWENLGTHQTPGGRKTVREPVGEIKRWSFTGIHVVDPAIFRLSERTGAFSIITLYLELAAQGWMIDPLDVSQEEWMDIGTPERLQEARRRYSP